MAITAEMRAQVMELYSAYFNRVIDKAGVDYWLNDMDVNGLNIIQISNAFANSDEYKAIYSGLTNEQIVAKVYQNVLNRDGDAAGVAYWTSELDSGAIAVENLVLAVITAAKEDKDELGDAMVLANKTAVNNYAFTNNNADKSISLSTITNDPASVAIVTEMIQNSGGSDVTDGDVQILTVSQDILKGTDGNDTFVAYVAQNMMGQQVNTLGSGDVINGGAGIDTLDAQITTGAWANGNTLGGLGMAVAPITNSVENIILHAEIADIATTNTDTVVVNAKYMNGVNKIVSNYSDASLLVQNMTTKGVGSTSKMTVGMEYTGNADTDWDEANMAVYFDQDYLTRSTVEENALYYFTQDRLTMNDSGRPFGANTTTVDGLNFTLNGVRKSVVIAQDKLDAFLAAVPADVTAAYQAFTALLVEALNIAKLTDSSLADLQISLDTSFVRTHGGIKNNGDPLKAPVPAIALTGSENDVLSSPKMHQNDSNLGSYDMFNDIDDSKAVANTPVAINVDLEKVGLAADGGALVIGSMNKDGTNTFDKNQDITVTDTVAGFDEFYVHVAGSKAKNSSLASLHSTDNTLRKVTIDSKDSGNANLIIGNTHSTGFATFGTSAGNASAFKDVLVMDASRFAGDLDLYAGITAEVAAKYFTDSVLLHGLNSVAKFNNYNNKLDRGADKIASFEYKGGSGNDDLNIAIDGVAAIENSIGIYDFTTPAITKNAINGNVFQMNINGGAGKDIITVTMDAVHTATYTGATNITINGGAGNDTINLTNDSVANSEWTYVVSFNGNFGTDKINNFTVSAGNTRALTEEVQLLNFTNTYAHAKVAGTTNEKITIKLGNQEWSIDVTSNMTATQIAGAVVTKINADMKDAGGKLLFKAQVADAAGAADAAGNYVRLVSDDTVGTGAGHKNHEAVVVTIGDAIKEHFVSPDVAKPIHTVTADTLQQGGAIYFTGTKGADVLDFSSYGVKGIAVYQSAALGTDVALSIATASTVGTSDKYLYIIESNHKQGSYDVFIGYTDDTLATGVYDATKGLTLQGTIDFGADKAFVMDNFIF